jgi:carbon monoxide dehydrogenase subunit G
MVQQAIEVSAPLHTVYEQLAAFENYPRFMTGVERVTPIGNQQTHWVMDVDGTRREFDAQITELSFDERVAWATTDGPQLSETITVRPMGETRTQVVAQLEADIALLMPSDRHGQQTLNRRLKDDLSTFKSLVESGRMAAPPAGGASSKQMAGRSSTIFGSGPHVDPASPASVAARIRNKPHPGAGWGTSAGPVGNNTANMGSNVDIASAPGITSAADLDDVLAPGRRIATPGAIRGGAAGAPDTGRAGSAPMGGRTPKNDGWGDGMINEEDRGSAYDYGT